MAAIDIIKYLASGDNIKAQDEINSTISQKALDAIAGMKQDVAQTYFSGMSGVQEESSGFSGESGEKVAGAILKKLRKEDVETLEEAKRIVHKYEPTHEKGHTAKVYRDPENNEYQVHFFKHGKSLGEGPVHYTDDKDDAIGTAKLQTDKLNSK